MSMALLRNHLCLQSHHCFNCLFSYSHQDATKSSSISEIGIGIAVHSGEDSNFDEHGSAGAVIYTSTPTKASISFAPNRSKKLWKLQATLGLEVQLMWEKIATWLMLVACRTRNDTTLTVDAHNIKDGFLLMISFMIMTLKHERWL